MTEAASFEALTVESLPLRLGGIEALARRIGKDVSTWKVSEVGDGNLKLVFIVEGSDGA
ncbi:S-methyl-5-thioribose kinase, partial [Rhizobiaceae sp. 2RAB30]